ncbi:MAG: hypothetical protein K2N73_10380 [Lachnospiraceae bacterium]|nr:hypothetical protein [Lachnospiraceae bacterium]
MENRDNVSGKDNNEVFAYELLSDARDNSERWFKAFLAMVKINLIEVFVMLAMVFAFIWYLNQYDFVSTVEQTGIYTLTDSQGNVISADITPEQIKEIMEILNDGKDEGNENKK